MLRLISSVHWPIAAIYCRHLREQAAENLQSLERIGGAADETILQIDIDTGFAPENRGKVCLCSPACYRFETPGVVIWQSPGSPHDLIALSRLVAFVPWI